MYSAMPFLCRNSRRFWSATLVMILDVSILCSCGTSWEKTAIERLNSGQASKALAGLERVEEDQRSPAWFVLVSEANAVLYKSTGQDRYSAAALRAMDMGIEKFPASARLLLDKAYVLFSVGKNDAARDCLRTATALAEKQLKANPSGKDSEINRGVLRQAGILKSELSR